MRERPALTIGILAGGAGRRWGGRDKGWVELDGRPMIERLLATLSSVEGLRLISANRSLARYRALDIPVVPDREPGFAGPLAGIAALLAASATDRLLTLPVDVVNVPVDLPRQLAGALDDADVVVLEDDDGRQPLVACYRVPAARASIERAWAAGERAVHRWQASMPARVLRLPGLRIGNRNAP